MLSDWTSNDCSCFTASADSVKSQTLKRLTGTEQVLNEIDWQFSVPRIVTEVPGSPMARLRCFRKITKNTSMCSNDKKFFLDADHY